MEETYSWQHSVTTDIFSIEGDKIELEWPEETLWKITSDRSPCEVCEHAYTYTSVTHHTGNLFALFHGHSTTRGQSYGLYSCVHT